MKTKELTKNSHGGKRENQSGRPPKLGPNRQIQIRFEETTIVDVDYFREDQSFADYVRQAVKEKVKRDDEEKGEKY
jgi:hypothetical protein